MTRPEFYKFTVEFEIHKDWIADGFVMTDARALDMLASDLGYADVNTELRARVVAFPNLDHVAQEQGYRNAKAMLTADPQLKADLLASDATA
jgi:hypothetical protein